MLPKAGSEQAGLAFEMSKLQNHIKLRERELDAVKKEATTLKSALCTAQRLLEQRAGETDRIKDRMLKAEGTAAAHAKELAQLKMDKRKLESSLSDLQRAADKFKEKINTLSSKGPGSNEQVASLQSEVKLLKKTIQQLTEDHKAAVSAIRAKDKQLELEAARLKAAAAMEDRMHELEREVAATKKALEQANAETRTLTQVTRTQEADIVSLTKALDGSNASLEATRQELSITQAQLKVTEAGSAQLSNELAVTRDELARTAAVAARAAAADARLVGLEGTVPAGQHLEEVRFLNGTIGRLRDKLASTEKEAAVAHALKERYRSACEAAQLSVSELDLAAGGATGCGLSRRNSTGLIGRCSSTGPGFARRSSDAAAGLAAAMESVKQASAAAAAAAAASTEAADDLQRGVARLSLAGKQGSEDASGAASQAGAAAAEEAPGAVEAAEAAGKEPAVAQGGRRAGRGGKGRGKKPAVEAAQASDREEEEQTGGEQQAGGEAAAAAPTHEEGQEEADVLTGHDDDKGGVAPAKGRKGRKGRGKAAAAAAAADADAAGATHADVADAGAAAAVEGKAAAVAAAAAAEAAEQHHPATRRTTRRARHNDQAADEA